MRAPAKRPHSTPPALHLHEGARQASTQHAAPTAAARRSPAARHRASRSAATHAKPIAHLTPRRHWALSSLLELACLSAS
eukprot:CAMPEP_0204331128 /NCGR_PEP_ID=MMETSP0469-20131031/15460_1 /ASSEMBLY_ACC=CAM_ASM_000384 /TAXON_ID=2969 /ORGANISM="Oxyrrhis marina" /LENGTH=79 /DNA_ID=CAMNT_0051314061 /DNA_START=106 /DNA_END=342 /DNA_ORIENTATION=+